MARCLIVACGCRGLDLRAPLQPAAGTKAVRDALREEIEGPGPDRWLAPELAGAEGLVMSGLLITAAAAVVGELE